MFYSLIGLFMAFTYGCEKIVAEDISEKTPVLILPTVYDTIGSNPVHFKWEAMEGATKYRLQIVGPGFSNISEYLLDSVITLTDFYMELDSNEYEMKLTALNGAYESVTLGPLKFWVGVQSTVSNNVVTLLTPEDQKYESELFDNKFSWIPLSDASSYEFSIRKGSSFQTGDIIDQQNTISTFTYTVPDELTEGTYFWGVKAYLSTGETNFTVRTLYIDTTGPNLPVLSTPADNASVTSGDVSFIWNNGSDPGTIHSPVHSYFELATDAAFTSTVPGTPIDLQTNTFTINLSSGIYYWRVTNSDEAGHSSGESTTFTFTIF